MTLDELKDYLRKSGIKHFNVVTKLVGPDNEWTEAEQEEDCCQLVPDHDPCVEVGKTEPWNGWTEEEKQELGWYPKPGQTTPEELLANAEQKYGKGNVHLKIRKTGPRPCGEKITRWSGSLSCCTSPAELVKFSGATTAAPDDVETYSVLGGTGEPPITWHTIGAGVTVAKTDATSARANFDDCFCKPVVIYAQDTCLSVAPWVVGRPDGSWASIDDESLSSPFGWYQDGTTGSFYITGFNDDNTKVSTQHYWHAEYVGTKEVVCGTTMPGINENPIVTPADGSQAFEKCENANIWVRLREGFSNVWEVRYAIDSQSTSEYTPGTCADELEMDFGDVVVADYSSQGFSWTGGIGPFSITVSGVEAYVDAGRSETVAYPVATRSATVYTGDSCGMISVTVTDSCGASVTDYMRNATGEWYLMYETHDGTTVYIDTCPIGDIYITEDDWNQYGFGTIIRDQWAVYYNFNSIDTYCFGSAGCEQACYDFMDTYRDHAEDAGRGVTATCLSGPAPYGGANECKEIFAGDGYPYGFVHFGYETVPQGWWTVRSPYESRHWSNYLNAQRISEWRCVA